MIVVTTMNIKHITNPRAATLLLIGTAVTGAIVLSVLIIRQPTHLTINEVSFIENDGNDWIELFNPSLNSLSVKGYYLTDDAKNLQKYRIASEAIIASQGFLLLYGEDYEGAPDGALTLSFNIADGETLYLIAPDGSTVVDRLTVIQDGAKTVGRFRDGTTDTFTFSNATPGAPNDKDEVSPPTP